MTPLDGWRREIRGVIPRGFLRRDQGGSLFVSDYPRRGNGDAVSQVLTEAGYTVEIQEELAFIDGSLKKYRALADALPDADFPLRENCFWLHALALHMKKTGGCVDLQNLHLLRLTLKLLDGGDFPGLERLLPPAAAEAQRRHIPLPKAAGQLILWNLQELERRDPSC